MTATALPPEAIDLLLAAYADGDHATADRLAAMTPDEWGELLAGGDDEPEPATMSETFAAPPGGPPRPGLTWKQETHRWVHPETGEEHDHPAPPAPHDDATPHERTLLARLREVPVGLVNKVSDFLKGKYATLAERYGPTGAKAVLAAAVLLTPVPLPGTTLLPIAIAEGIRRLRAAIAGTKAEVEKGATMAEGMTDAAVQAAARELLAELYAACGEGATFAEFDKDAHPRGHEGNAGQFVKKGEGGSGGDKDGKADKDAPPAKEPTGENHDSAASPSTESHHDAAKDYKENGTKSKAFTSWFGDWENDPAGASKVVDQATGEPAETHAIPGTGEKKLNAKKKPMVVYHGTANGNFESFDKNKMGDIAGLLYGPGFYFSEDEGVAREYKKKDAESVAIGSNEEVGSKAKEKLRQARESGRLTRDDADELDYALGLSDAELGEKLVSVNGKGGYFTPDGVDFDELVTEPGSEIKSVYLNVRNPFDVDGDFSPDEVSKILGRAARIPSLIPGKHGGQQVYDFLASESLASVKDSEREKLISKYGSNQAAGKVLAQELLSRAGYDGITHIGGDRMGGGHHHRVWIAFEPTQIKAVDNAGTFDPNDPRMKFSDAPPG